MKIDLKLVSYYSHDTSSLRDGVESYVELLSLLMSSRLCAGGWFFAMPEFEGDKTGVDPIVHPEQLSNWLERREQRKLNDLGTRPTGMGPSWSANAREPGGYHTQTYAATYSWGDVPATVFSMPFWNSAGLGQPEWRLYSEVIEALLDWKTPGHVSIRPTFYMIDHYPLSRARLGIGWMGWLPVQIAAADLPQAEIVQPMKGGTLIVGQRAFWQAAGPNEDKAAIARAQDLDVALAAMGVLPTFDEVNKGWPDLSED